MTTLILTGLGTLGYLLGLYQGNPIDRSGLNILRLVLEIVTIYYLLKPNVKRAFHRTTQDTI